MGIGKMRHSEGEMEKFFFIPFHCYFSEKFKFLAFRRYRKTYVKTKNL